MYGKLNMKVVLFLLVAMFTAPASSQINKPKPPPPPPVIETKPLDLQTALDDTDHYPRFITTLRNQLNDPKLKRFDVPMLRQPSTPPKYIYVELISTTRKSIKIAINTNDIYIVAYSDRDQQGRVRAHFLQKVPSNAEKTVFTNAKISRKMPFDAQYSKIEGQANIKSRGELGLGIKLLDSYVNKVSGAVNKGREFGINEAKFILIVAQTVSEAVRFTYIENQIRDHLHYEYFKLNNKVLNLELEWGKMSKAIATADDLSRKITIDSKERPTLVNEDGSPREVENVDDIKGDMGLLNYVAPRLPSYVEWPMMQVVDSVAESAYED